MQKNKRNLNQSESETFSRLEIPPETSFFIRLDGWRFQAISEAVNTEKPFDQNFAICLVTSGKALFQFNFNPTLVYVASDEINTLFLRAVLFGRRVEKIDSISAGVISSAFSLCIQRLFKRTVTTAFDSRIILSPSQKKITEYLIWRQKEAYRNHNNAHAYWLLRKKGYTPSETAKMLKGLKTEDLHEALFTQGINLVNTPAWQRRGILIYREPYQKQVRNHVTTRRQTKENWKLPLFSSTEGQILIQQILNGHNRSS